jgi:formiminotetrahydrofolate cyclodeaminase
VLSASVEEFLDELARDTPVPGAGPASAVVTAAAAALTAMAARASFETWPDAGGVAAQAESLRARAVRLADEAADALTAVLAERSGAGGERAEMRDFRLGRTLHRAAAVPLSIVEAAADVALLASHTADHCAGDVRPDATAAAFLAHGAARAAAHLVEINLATVAGDERVKRADGLVRAAGAAADEAARKAEL